MVEITCVVDARAELGEGTLWDPQAGVLWWIDIWQKLIHRYDPATGKDETFEAPEYLGCLGLREKGGLVLTMASGFHFFDPATGRFEAIVDPEAHMPETRFNDGKPDRQGRFWSGSMFEVPGRPIEFVGALYRMDPDLSVHRMIEGVGCSNGLAWSPDSRTMYFSDSHSGRVDAYDFDAATGDIENRRTFIDMTRHRRRRRRRDGRCRGLLLGDHPGHQQGLPLRSGRQADADGRCCRPTCRPAASSAARTSTSSMSPRRCSSARPRILPDRRIPAGCLRSTSASRACRCRRSKVERSYSVATPKRFVLRHSSYSPRASSCSG